MEIAFEEGKMAVIESFALDYIGDGNVLARHHLLPLNKRKERPSRNATFSFSLSSGHQFGMSVYKAGKEWFPNFLWHRTKGECPCCGQDVVKTWALEGSCSALEPRLMELARAFVRHPSLRIEAQLRLKASLQLKSLRFLAQTEDF